MQWITLLLCLWCTSPVFSLRISSLLSPEWHSWKAEHTKTYSSFHAELQGHITWKANQALIDAHNSHKEVFGFSLKMNQFGDLSDVEFARRYLCVEAPYKQNGNTSLPNQYTKIYQPPLNYSFPEMVDWRSMGVVSPVKSQGDCCSCYAFSAVETLEGVNALASDHLVELSAQNILDCSDVYGNYGCYRGSTSNAFSYIISDGVDTANSYPYEGQQGTCRYKTNAIGAKMRHVIQIDMGNERDLQSAVTYQGPVAVSIDGSPNMFRFYSHGVLSVPNCSRWSPSHALIIIGYGTYFNRDYWLVKNSWGGKWGMDGFGMMSRNRYNQCGIATQALFPAL